MNKNIPSFLITGGLEQSFLFSVIPYSSTMGVLAFSFEMSEPGCQKKHWSDAA